MSLGTVIGISLILAAIGLPLYGALNHSFSEGTSAMLMMGEVLILPAAGILIPSVNTLGDFSGKEIVQGLTQRPSSDSVEEVEARESCSFWKAIQRLASTRFFHPDVQSTDLYQKNL